MHKYLIVSLIVTSDFHGKVIIDKVSHADIMHAFTHGNLHICNENTFRENHYSLVKHTYHEDRIVVASFISREDVTERCNNDIAFHINKMRMNSALKRHFLRGFSC